ncbi:MAG: methyltransferase domain-containing protein, partial [Caldilineaceae bacterium]|nr:methyltransferase domain-containing protein [Caldilineaceae bacterium]
MEYVKCHNCGSDQSSYYATENGYNLVRCAECGLIYLNPRPDAEEIQDAHKLGVHRGEHDFDITGHFDKGKIRNYLKILRDFYTPEQLAGSSWLDVGCGHGEFLVALREFTNGNIQLRGLEPNVQKQISAQKQGLDVSQFDLATHEQRYDRISLLNVYGHLPDPVGMLSTLRTLLLPSGELLLETGDSA